MVMKAELTIDLSVEEDIKKFKKQFREEIVEKSLDEPISKSLKELRQQLNQIVNQDIPAQETRIVNGKKIQAPVSQSSPAREASTRTVLEYLTGADFNKYDSSKDYSTTSDGSIIVGHHSKNVREANRLTVRTFHDGGDTIEEHFNLSQKMFNENLIILPNNNGGFDYFINNGENLYDVNKIDCSTQTGTGDIEPNYGMSPQRRFNLDAETKGYSDWNLKQEFVSELRKGKKNFIHLNPIVDKYKEGDWETAISLLRQYKGDKADELVEKIENVQSDKGISQEVSSHRDIIALIKNIRLRKEIKKNIVIYRLISTRDLDSEQFTKFFNEAQTHITLWLSSNHDKWFKAMVRATSKLIKNFSRQ